MLKINKKVIAILLVFAICVIAVPSISQASGAKYKIRLATHYSIKHPAVKVLETIKKDIEQKSNGDIKITIYPGNALGDYAAVYEEIMRGSIEMGNICTTGQYDKRLEMNYVPALFTTYKEAARVFSSDSYFFDKYNKLNKKLGVKLLGVYLEGFIGVGLNSLPEGLADPTVKKKELIRVWPSNVAKLTMQDIGYSTLTIPYADLFSALQTGVADGWFGGTSQLNYLSFRDAIKYYIPYNLCAETTFYLINAKLFDSMPEKYQKLIQDEFQKASLASIDSAKEEDKLYMQKLVDYGIKIVDLSDKQRVVIAEHIRRVTWPKLYDKFGKEIMTELMHSTK